MNRRAYGSGTLYQRTGDGRWVFGIRRDGVRVSFYGRTPEDAIAQASGGERPLIDETCLHCGKTFQRRLRSKRRLCSPACKTARGNRLHRGRRQALDRDGLVSPAELGDRAGWVCRICGEAIDQSVRWPDREMASVDHIIPVAAGGTNDPGNLQLVHLRCNIRKGVKSQP